MTAHDETISNMDAMANNFAMPQYSTLVRVMCDVLEILERQPDHVRKANGAEINSAIYSIEMALTGNFDHGPHGMAATDLINYCAAAVQARA